jgi:hypothetical protein
MNTKRFLLAGCATIILSAGTAQAGPCDTEHRGCSLLWVDLPSTGHCGARTSTEGEVL